MFDPEEALKLTEKFAKKEETTKKFTELGEICIAGKKVFKYLSFNNSQIKGLVKVGTLALSLKYKSYIQGLIVFILDSSVASMFIIKNARHIVEKFKCGFYMNAEKHRLRVFRLFDKKNY